MKSKKRPMPPRELSPRAKTLWKELFDASDMDVAAIVLLNLMCQQFDRLQQARKIVAAEGVTITEKTAAGNEKTRAHPALQIEHQALQSICRCWKTLGYDQMPPESLR